MRYTGKALKVRTAIDKAGVFLTDEQALIAVELYPPYKTGVSVKVGERYRQENDLYKVIQEHVTQADWLPSITPALFVKVSLDEWPEFVQPTGQHDAYAFGAKITFNGKHYVSLITANTYSPLAYPAGWKLQ